MWIFTHFFAPEPVFGIFPLIFEHNPRDFQAWSAEKYWALVYDDKKSGWVKFSLLYGWMGLAPSKETYLTAKRTRQVLLPVSAAWVPPEPPAGR